MKPSALLLDLDRTLVDVQTFTDYEAAIAGIPEAAGSRSPDTPATDWRPATRIAMDTLVALAGSERWQQVSDLIEEYELAAVPQSRLMPGVFEFLTAVGGRPVAVVTLMGPRAARAALAHHDIDLPILLGRTAGHRPKPAPDQLLAACRELGVAPAATVMVGDSTWDQAAAVAAGCGFVGLTLGGKVEFPAGVPAVPWLGDAVSLLTRLGPRSL